MSKRRSTRVYISFPLAGNWQCNDERIEMLAEKYNFKDVGSGAGFGMRDLDFELTEKSDLKGFKVAVDNLNIKGLVVFC